MMLMRDVTPLLRYVYADISLRDAAMPAAMICRFSPSLPRQRDTPIRHDAAAFSPLIR